MYLYFHRVSTDVFIVTLLVRIYRKHFPWFPDLWWLWGLEGRTSGTSRPTCLFGWRNIKVKKTSLGDTRWDIFDVQFPGGKACVFDMQFPGGKAYVLGMSLNMVWKMKSRLIYFKSLIQKRRHIRQDKTRRPMFTTSFHKWLLLTDRYPTSSSKVMFKSPFATCSYFWWIFKVQKHGQNWMQNCRLRL